jgi:hypothetical protein
MSQRQYSPQERLVMAALDVVVTVSPDNLRHGRSPTVKVPRAYLVSLAEALEGGWPDLLERGRQVMADRERERR